MSTKFIENQVKRVESMKRPLQAKLAKLDENFKRMATTYKEKRAVIVEQLTSLDGVKNAFSKPIVVDVESVQNQTIESEANAESPITNNEVAEEQVFVEKSKTDDNLEQLAEGNPAEDADTAEWK